MTTQHTLTIKRFSAGLCALLFAYASMSTAFADKKGMPNENSLTVISGWTVVCEPDFSVTSDTKELSNILLVFNDETWEKYEIEDGNLTFTYTYEDPTRKVVTAFVKAGSEKTAKDDRYGGNKLGYEIMCGDSTNPGA